MIQNISTPQRTVLRDPDTVPKDIERVAWRACGIANVAQKVKHRPDLQRLARDAGAAVCAVLHRCTTADNIVVANNTHGLKTLFETLSSIERFTEKRISEHVFIRVVKRVPDLPKIRGYGNDLEQVLGCFGLTSGDLIPQNLEHIASQLQQTLKELSARKRRQGEASTHRQPHAQGNLAQSPFQSQQTNGVITRTIIDGNQTTIRAALRIENSNSGNSTTTITTNSNNISGPMSRL